ncbi:MAG: dihydrodipicolinate synthase family protein, partial [Mesorhizobium sp.]
MWTGVFPAVTTKFTADDRLDHAEMERCYSLQMEAGCDGIIVCGSLGEGPMLSPDEKIEVLKTAQKVAGKKPV